MPQGLQVWDRNGSSTLDVSDSLTRVLGMIQTKGGDGDSGSFNDDRLLSGRPWFAIVLQKVEFVMPAVTISGSTISWASEKYFNTSACTLYYGVY